jgi:hypothetical protein
MTNEYTFAWRINEFRIVCCAFLFLHVLELVQIRQIIINLKLQNDGKFQKRTKLHFFAL